jgi:hypothetical protein
LGNQPLALGNQPVAMGNQQIDVNRADQEEENQYYG